MHRSGIVGFQNFDAALQTPKVVDKQLQYMEPEWKEAFRYATVLADSLGLEMAIAGSPGWSESGGPWVPAKDGMKKIVWSELRIAGGQPFSGVVPKPPSNTGVFQNIPYPASTGKPAPVYYKDIALLAYRLPDADRTLSELNPKITSSGGNFNLRQLSDGDLVAGNAVQADSGKEWAWIQFEFPAAQIIKAVTVVGGGIRWVWGVGAPSEDRMIEASDDGISFRRIAFIHAGGVPQHTVAFEPVSARFFRVSVF